MKQEQKEHMKIIKDHFKKKYQKQTCCFHKQQPNGDILGQAGFQWWTLCQREQT